MSYLVLCGPSEQLPVFVTNKKADVNDAAENGKSFTPAYSSPGPRHQPVALHLVVRQI